MELYFIRHGQSVNNALWSTTGCSRKRVEDPELTVTGLKQAEMVAEFLAQTPTPQSDSSEVNSSGQRGNNCQSDRADPETGKFESTNLIFGGFSLTHLYTSLMVRAVQTGTIISKRVGVPLTAWQDLHECGGIYLDGSEMPLQGRSRDYFESSFPKLILPDTLDNTGWWNLPFENETDRRRRAQRVAKRLRADHGDSSHRVGIVTHGEFYSRLLCHLLQIPEGHRIWFTLHNTAVTRIDMDPTYLNVVYLNRVEFLPAHLIT